MLLNTVDISSCDIGTIASALLCVERWKGKMQMLLYSIHTKVIYWNRFKRETKVARVRRAAGAWRRYLSQSIDINITTI